MLNALSFGELRVDDVMVPRADIRAIEINTGLDDVVAAMREPATRGCSSFATASTTWSGSSTSRICCPSGTTAAISR
ncbi:MAG: hypothetical protein R3C69_00375 [Geminicoccaceae bacterium]